MYLFEIRANKTYRYRSCGAASQRFLLASLCLLLLCFSYEGDVAFAIAIIVAVATAAAA